MGIFPFLLYNKSIRGDLMQVEEILSQYPWIKDEHQKLIISPDSDGLLCALLYLNYFDGEVVGFYDGKVMLVKDGISPIDCLFLDMDIFHSSFRSVGHHMVMLNKKRLPSNWDRYQNCLQVNNLRNFDKTSDFQRKYPLATIHFLLTILSHVKKIKLSEEAVVPLLFSDGVWIVLFGYTENCLEWFDWLGITKEESILYPIFCGKKSFLEIMQDINDFLRQRDSLNSKGSFDFQTQTFIEKASRRTGDRLIISTSKGEPVNIEKKEDHLYDIYQEEVNRVICFIELLAHSMGWNAKLDKWNFKNLKLYPFKKSNLDGKNRKLNLKNYNEVVENHCFSMAITSSTQLEYTIDEKHLFDD